MLLNNEDKLKYLMKLEIFSEAAELAYNLKDVEVNYIFTLQLDFFLKNLQIINMLFCILCEEIALVFVI